MTMPAKAPAAPATESATPDRLDTQEFARNMLTVGVKSQQLLVDFAARMAARENPVPLDPLNISGAMLSLAKAMRGDREAVVEAQTQWWNNFMTLWESTARKMLGGEAPSVVEPAPGDRRFKAEAWRENEVFDFIKQSYLLTANAMQEMVGKLHGLDEKERGRIAFYTRQFADALAPTNFPLTNPDVLKATIASNGENLVKGLDNLLADIERGHGELSIRQTSGDFAIGENVATAPGKVVFRNQIMELLQYSPATDEVYERPLLIFPPWINKYYILDLRPENSFVRWLVGQGYTVFLVSWVNPDPDMADKGFEDYMQDGIFAALDAVEKATGVRDPNCVGYCIGGTLLAATLAYMAAQKGDKGDRIHSATFWAAQTDFSEAGELSVFVDEAQLEALKAQMDSGGGVLPGSKMAGAFNMLRANDLIWSFVINNYLLGKQPMPFDLLYWNSDTTRMPEKLHLSYLRQCYKENALASGEMKLGGVKLDLSKVKVPVYLQSAREDHIAPANSVFKSVNLFGGPVRFIIAGSGHIAGVINPPAAKKYQYWTNDSFAEKGGAKTIDAWKKGSSEHPGSWWPDWDKWLSALSGGKVPARQPGDGELKALADAPGTYVKVKGQ
ncbi:MAG TPA: class I poly(R)-hydroxyalkanoic acid synthase [Rhizomicrobium sp.]|jgi:polyhydroxyalkanoate synthase|nr:class I poly(R)-hydroxyalkanoic acid synthase [Rhizomicrobium sp.]